MDYLICGVLLILQQASHTATSRARNTKGARGIWYNAIASVFSNGVWFSSQFFIVNVLIEAKGDHLRFALTLAFYVVFAVSGSVGAHWWLMKFESKRGLQHG